MAEVINYRKKQKFNFSTQVSRKTDIEESKTMKFAQSLINLSTDFLIKQQRNTIIILISYIQTKMKIKAMACSLIFSVLLLLILTTNCTSLHPLLNFGSNRPHLLFHVGQREPISLNIGWGYWQNHKQSPSKLRLWYQNKQSHLYVDTLSHNGEDHFETYIEDSKLNLESSLKYQLVDKENQKCYQIKIAMHSVDNSESIKKLIEPSTQFAYFSIENHDERLIDKQKLSTPKFIIPEKQNGNVVVLRYFDALKNKTQKITIKGRQEQQLNIFGLSANISQTFNILSYAQAFKNLLTIKQYPNLPRSNDTKIVKWENQQLKFIDENKWVNQKFIFVFVYTNFDQQSQLIITNSTESSIFDNEFFQRKTQQISKQLFGQDQSVDDLVKHSIYNLLGGLAFYQGKLLTQNSPILLNHDFSYSFTPSRLIFPRAFLWDDGFHSDIIAPYIPKLTLQVLQNWFNKINMLGWIGRQQIRGFSIASMMPDARFVYQDSFQMNPPTLFLAIERSLRKDKQNPFRKDIVKLLEKNFGKLQRWYQYFKQTQSHYSLIYNEEIEKQINYRWRCKDQCKKGNFMGSGLDDYPRTSQKDQISKRHVDLISWLIYFAKNIHRIAKELQLPSYVQHFYQNQCRTLNQSLFKDYLDQNDNLFKDIAVISDDVFIQKWVTHKGYINLFPFMLGIIPADEQKPSKEMRSVISLMLDEQQLLSQSGIRSLSLSDKFYGTQENYWRGPVWININYLILRACKAYYWNYPEIRELYDTIRSRVIETVRRNFVEKGYLFENYHKGKGNRGYPFTGWTASIANIIKETYI